MKIEIQTGDDGHWPHIKDIYCCYGMQRLYDFDYQTPIQFNPEKMILEFQAGLIGAEQCNYCPCCGAKVEFVIIPANQSGPSENEE
jgi:hypothetical protein